METLERQLDDFGCLHASSQGSDLDKVLGAGKTQRLISIRKRRHEERIQKVLEAAHMGDLAELKNLLKVSGVTLGPLGHLECNKSIAGLRQSFKSF